MRFTRNNDIKHTLTHVDTNSFAFEFRWVSRRVWVFGVERVALHSVRSFGDCTKISIAFCSTIFIPTRQFVMQPKKKTFSSKFVPYKSTSHAFHCRSFSQCFQCINVGRLLHFIHLAIKLFILSLPCLPPFHTCTKLFISKRISYGRWRNYFRSWFWAAAPATPCTMRESQPKGKISVKLFTSLAYSLIVLFSFRLHAGILNIRDDITPSNEQ